MNRGYVDPKVINSLMAGIAKSHDYVIVIGFDPDRGGYEFGSKGFDLSVHRHEVAQLLRVAATDIDAGA